jgi:hypothetical protein
MPNWRLSTLHPSADQRASGGVGSLVPRASGDNGAALQPCGLECRREVSAETHEAFVEATSLVLFTDAKLALSEGFSCG